MPGRITLTITPFGAFRAFAGQPITLPLPKGASLREVREALKEHFGFDRMRLVDESAFADEKQVLREEAIFERDTELAILPPVCGG